MKTPEQTQALRDLHNSLCPEVVGKILRGVIGAGGQGMDMMPLLETVVAGVLVHVITENGDEVVTERFMERVRDRMAELRQHIKLRDGEVAGSA